MLCDQLAISDAHLGTCNIGPSLSSAAQGHTYSKVTVQMACYTSYPHHWVFQGRDTSKVAGLSCRSGRVVLAGDRNYNPVPITMILREHEDDIRGNLASKLPEMGQLVCSLHCNSPFRAHHWNRSAKCIARSAVASYIVIHQSCADQSLARTAASAAFVTCLQKLPLTGFV